MSRGAAFSRVCYINEGISEGISDQRNMNEEHFETIDKQEEQS